jgi:hypothetical protein
VKWEIEAHCPIKVKFIVQKQFEYQIVKRYKKMTSKLISKIYRDNVRDLGKSILLVGSARSGTTWLANLIASQFQSRIMFEPFNPILVQEYKDFNYFQYMRPDDENEALYDYCRKIFSGNIRNAWIDREVRHLFPERRIIKCVRASLMLKWIDNRFPEVPKIFIVRHPCAVVLSRMRLVWATDDDIRYFLEQPKLMADFLDDHMEAIKNSRTDEEKHAIIWAITNLVPIKQFQKELHIFRYESLVQNPEEEVSRLFELLRIPYRSSVLDELRQPSSTASNKSAIWTGKNINDQWKKELNQEQIHRILNIVDIFGLSTLLEP